MSTLCSPTKAAASKVRILKSQQRRYITLIEMIVVMTIIAFVAGLIGINITKAMQEQRFRTEVAMVLDKLRLAQNLMLILNEDVSVVFKTTKEGITLHLNYQCPLNSGWDRELTRKSQHFTSIKKVQFEGIEQHEEHNRDSFELNFLSAGMVMSQGVLVLSTGSQRYFKDKSYIRLYGYPHPLTAVKNKDLLTSSFESNNHTDALTQYVMPEIILKFQSQKQPTTP